MRNKQLAHRKHLAMTPIGDLFDNPTFAHLVGASASDNSTEACCQATDASGVNSQEASTRTSHGAPDKERYAQKATQRNCVVVRPRARTAALSLSPLKHYPSTPAAIDAIARLLDRIAETDDQIDWICDKILQEFDEWPGPKTLRSVYCKKFKPADSKEA